ncbi:phosphinothricin acetyltransferase [Aureimonas altamirensis DSM 21988]|uniref:Phosphinothricin acetyltransferase n=1 Tax=Aureimonas altamirensis DSM 21988 TaxID=1121026 RepID=A0ABY1IDV4_9HYPH|nr:GNAT family N-acetyltransferase [Aureimonas altamirensis]SHJ03192.1 phosphinothricin acetyltransferase [Aureimonas altamirensis DSM 21988]
MSAFTLRDAGPADIPAITAIYRHAVLHGTATFEVTPPDEAEMATRMQTLLTQGYPYIVAVSAAGEVVAYAYAGPFRTRPAYRWSVEDSIYIDPGHHGKGIGRALLTRLLELCTEKGFRQMIAVIGGSDHAPSIRLHERAGFAMIGVFEGSGFKFGRWIDTVFMQMRLGDGRHSLPDEHRYPGTM